MTPSKNCTLEKCGNCGHKYHSFEEFLKEGTYVEAWVIGFAMGAIAMILITNLF